MKYVFVLLIGLLLYGCGSEEKSHIYLSPDTADAHSEALQAQNDIDKQVVKAFFGDEEFNRVVVVDVDHMKLLAENLYTDHLKTHTADKVAGEPKVYVVNRGSDAIDVVDTRTFDLTKTIALAHHPRSAEAMNKAYGLCAVSGMDKPMVSIIDTMTDEVVATVGDDIVTYPVQTHGGKHACGHPFWLDKDHFVLLDRARKEITTYTIYMDYMTGTWKTRKLNTIKTSSSIHQIIPSKGNYKGPKNIFYATAEGTDEVYPSIVKLILTQKGLLRLMKSFCTVTHCLL